MGKKHMHHEHHEHHSKSEETVTLSKTTIWQILTVVFLALFVLSLLTGGFSKGFGGKAAVANNPSPTLNNNAGQGEAPTITLEGANTMGSEDAPVVIVEWSDFQCPFCSRFALETAPSIKQNYVDTGKVLFVYKHFPLDSIHPMATPAALASECAAEQGKFWEYHDKVFENMASLSTANLKKWAGDLGLNTATFNSCLDSQKYADKVKADLQEGLAAGIRGTPGFLVNGELVSGAQPYSVFQQIIEAQLN